MCCVCVSKSLSKFWTWHTPYLYYTACCCFQFFTSIWDRNVWFPFIYSFSHVQAFAHPNFWGTTISLIKLLKDIFLHSSIYFMFLAFFSAFFWLCHQLTTSRMVCQGLPRLAGFAGVRWVLSGLTRFTGGIRPNWHRVDSYLKFIPFHGEW